MASGGHRLQQERPHLEGTIRTLTNPELKSICKHFGSPVSGVKAELQKRVIQVLAEAVQHGDVATFNEIAKQAGYRNSSFQHSSPSNYNSTPGYQDYTMAPQRGGASLPNRGRTMHFKASPFYEVLDTLLPLQDLPEMPQNRHTVKATLTIKNDLAQQFRNGNESLCILMYCGSTATIATNAMAEVAFPNQIEVKVNDTDVKANFKGLKNKPGSTKPADITSLMRKYGNQSNSIQVTYALTQKRYAFCIYLVRSISSEKLTQRIRSGRIIPRETVVKRMQAANADPDIAATSVRMSLKDPVSTMRITLPVRSDHCTHNQCFDGAMFLQLQDQAPQWSCPVCSKPVTLESLCIDQYFEDILNKTSKSIEKVDIEPNGEWKIIKEDDEVQANGTSSKARASYDDDFDDEVVDLDSPSTNQLNGVKKESQPSGLLSAMESPFSFNTPPLSSREPSVAQSASSAQRPGSKRPQSAIIDLTLSDDDDEEPPRSAKRQSTTNRQSQGTQSRSYNTPTSIPDGRPPTQNHNPGRADSYRPASNHSGGAGPSFDFSNKANNAAHPQSPLGRINTPFTTAPSWQNQQQPPRLPSLPDPAANNSSSGYTVGNPNNFTINAPNNFNSFTIRSPPVRPSSIAGNGSYGGLRLPPMQTHRQNGSSPNSNSSPFAPPGSWRGDSEFDFNSYGSPG